MYRTFKNRHVLHDYNYACAQEHEDTTHQYSTCSVCGEYMCCDISSQEVPSRSSPVCPTETQVGGEATAPELT